MEDPHVLKGYHTVFFTNGSKLESMREVPRKRKVFNYRTFLQDSSAYSEVLVVLEGQFLNYIRKSNKKKNWLNFNSQRERKRVVKL